MEEDDSLRQLFVESCRSHDTAEKPDEVNFRFYLWKSMHLFPELCEKKNRDVVPLFFDFIRFVLIHNWLLKFCVEKQLFTLAWYKLSCLYSTVVSLIIIWTSIFVEFRKMNGFNDMLIHGKPSDRFHLSHIDRNLNLLHSFTTISMKIVADEYWWKHSIFYHQIWPKKRIFPIWYFGTGLVHVHTLYSFW